MFVGHRTVARLAGNENNLLGRGGRSEDGLAQGQTENRDPNESEYRSHSPALSASKSVFIGVHLWLKYPASPPPTSA